MAIIQSGPFVVLSTSLVLSLIIAANGECKHDASKCVDLGNDCCENSGRCRDGYIVEKTSTDCAWFTKAYKCCAPSAEEIVETVECGKIDNSKCTTETKIDDYCVATHSPIHDESPGCLPGYRVEQGGTSEVLGFGGTGYVCRRECEHLIWLFVGIFLAVVSLCICGCVLICYVCKCCCWTPSTRIIPMTPPTGVPIQVCGSPIAAPAPIVAVTLEGSSLPDFLKSLGLERFESTFTGQEVTMSDLKLMSEKDLEALGLPMGPRMRILGALKK